MVSQFFVLVSLGRAPPKQAKIGWEERCSKEIHKPSKYPKGERVEKSSLHVVDDFLQSTCLGMSGKLKITGAGRQRNSAHNIFDQYV